MSEFSCSLTCFGDNDLTPVFIQDQRAQVPERTFSDVPTDEERCAKTNPFNRESVVQRRHPNPYWLSVSTQPASIQTCCGRTQPYAFKEGWHNKPRFHGQGLLQQVAQVSNNCVSRCELMTMLCVPLWVNGFLCVFCCDCNKQTTGCFHQTRIVTRLWTI